MTTPQELSGVQVQFSTSLQEGPDGTTWVGLTIETPFCAYVVGLSPAVARSVADPESGLSKMLRDTADLAERKGSGIMAVPADALNVLNRKNRE